MNKLLKLSFGIPFSVLLVSQLLFAQNNVTYKSIKLFESGYNLVPQSERVYSTHFSKDETRYIYYEIELTNNLYSVRDNPISMTAKFYKPDGSLMGEPVLDYTILSDWETAYLWHGWGWQDAGNWETGTYRVVINIGNRRIAETLFSVYDNYWDSPRASK